MSGSRKARGAGGLSSGDLPDWRRRPRCAGKADLDIRSSHARLGVLLLWWPGHVVACIRITSHELLRDGARTAVAFLLQHDISRCCLLGSTSFGTGIPRMGSSLASFLWHFCCKGCLQKGLMRPQAPAGIPPPAKRTGARRTSLGSSEGPPRPEPRWGHQR